LKSEETAVDCSLVRSQFLPRQETAQAVSTSTPHETAQDQNHGSSSSPLSRSGYANTAGFSSGTTVEIDTMWRLRTENRKHEFDAIGDACVHAQRLDFMPPRCTGRSAGSNDVGQHRPLPVDMGMAVLVSGWLFSTQGLPVFFRHCGKEAFFHHSATAIRQFHN
jgi:hypothetical protein